MTVRRFLAGTVIITLFFGLALLLFPAPLTSLYNLELGPGARLIARLFGATLVGWAALNWLARGLQDGPALGFILFGNFVVDVINFPVALLGQLRRVGGMNNLGWLTVAIYLSFTAGFGYYWWRMRSLPGKSNSTVKT